MNTLSIGTEKQIKYATDIRNYVLYQVRRTNIKEEKKQFLISLLEKQDNAKTIIDCFINVFNSKKVVAAINEFINGNYTDLEVFKKLSVSNSSVKDIEYTKTDKFTKATKKQKDYISRLFLNRSFMLDKKYHQMFLRLDSLSINEAKELIQVLRECQASRYNTQNYYIMTFDSFDCETGEKIYKGEQVWKDHRGLHKM